MRVLTPSFRVFVPMTGEMLLAFANAVEDRFRAGIGKGRDRRSGR